MDGKCRDVTRDDLMVFADKFGIERAAWIIGDVQDAVRLWSKFTKQAGLPAAAANEVAAAIGRRPN